MIVVVQNFNFSERFTAAANLNGPGTINIILMTKL